MDNGYQQSLRDIPTSYQENSREETEILRLADNFHRQFRYLYPNRIKPPLYLENECNVKKLVCSSICPLKVSMPVEMRKWDFCANFFAEYFDYEVLQHPTVYPQKLTSLDTIIKKRTGNSLELSMVLCTFLLVSNYDAYVVQGYARRNICEKWQSKDTRPPIKFDTDSEYHKLYFTSAKQNNKSVPNKYQQNFELIKSFWMEGESAFQFQEDAPEKVVEAFEEDVLLGKRIHFWLLIYIYEHGLANSFFIEPATGEIKSVDDLNYLGIEFVWNDKNFWCNKQISKLSCKNMNFDFNNCVKWEAFLPDYNIDENSEKSFRMPGTWIRDIEIRPEHLDSRFPKEGRHVHYKMAKIEKYNLNATADGLVYRMTYFITEKKDDPMVCHAFFKGRKDLLEYRKTDFENKFIEDVFAPGRLDALKQHEYPLEESVSFPQKLVFYSYCRKDGLSYRRWEDALTVDEFCGRSDMLKEREVRFFCVASELQAEAAASDELKQITSEPLVTEVVETNDSVENVEKLEKSNTSLDEMESLEFENTQQSSEDLKQEIICDTKSEEVVAEDSIKGPDQGSICDASNETLTLGLGPTSFDSVDIILDDVDFNSWSFEYFLENIDPSERYATSESESEEQEMFKRSDTKVKVSDIENDIKEHMEKEHEQEYKEQKQSDFVIKDKNEAKISENSDSKHDDDEECLSTEIFKRNDSKERILDKVNDANNYSEERDQQENGDLANSKDKNTKIDDVEKLQNVDLTLDPENIYLSKASDDSKENKADKGNANAYPKENTEPMDEKESHKYIKTTDESIETDAVKTAENSNLITDVEEDLYDDDVITKDNREYEEEGEFDKKMEIYDEINFDALSDEELEIDYQLYLSKLWEEYARINNKEIFYISREFLHHKDLRKKDILNLKKKIIRKRRRNVRYLQRVQTGKPAERIHKRKVDEVLEGHENVYTKDLITYLNLQEIIGIDKIASVEEFCSVENLEEVEMEAVNAEVIKKETLKILDNIIKNKNSSRSLDDQGNIRLIKNTYELDESLPIEHAVENAWFELETDSYRLDFHYPKNQSSRKTLLFTKPDSGITDFTFANYLCREILPSFETKRTKKCQRYSYLVALMKKEPLVLREQARFDEEMKNILETRRGEEDNSLKKSTKGIS